MEEAKVKLCDYTGIPVEVADPSVSDEMVAEVITSGIENYNLYSMDERTIVEENDTVYCSITFTDKDGNVLTDETFDGFVTLGEGSTYEEIEAALVGAEAGTDENVEVAVTLEDPYEADEELSGAEVNASVHLVYIQEDEPIDAANPTDDDIRKAFNVESLEAYQAQVRESLENEKQQYLKSEAYSQICEYLGENCTVDPFPDLELASRLDRYMAEMEETCKTYYNMEVSDYLSTIGMTEESYKEMMTSSLTDAIRLELIYSAISDKEQIVGDDEDYEAYLSDILESFEYETAEELYAVYGEDYVKNAYRIEFVVDYLIEQAEITYTDEDEVHADDAELLE